MVRLSPDILHDIAPWSKPLIVAPVTDALNEFFPVFQITTLLRVAHFLAQAAHETDGFKTLEEYASGRDYEGRVDLGNTQKGDGRRFKGRGIFQLTGRANYTKMAKRLNLPLLEQPELAAAPRTSAHIACLYWSDRKLNDAADRDDIKAVTKAINGGYNGLNDRAVRLLVAKKHLASLFLDDPS